MFSSGANNEPVLPDTFPKATAVCLKEEGKKGQMVHTGILLTVYITNTNDVSQKFNDYI